VLAVAKVGDGWRLVDAPHVIIDANGVATIPAGRPVTGQEVAHLAGPAGVLVLAPADALWSDVHALGFALHRECWTFAAAHAGALTATWPAKCPQDSLQPADRERAELAVWIDSDRSTIGSTPFPAGFGADEHAAITRRLLQHRAMPRFANRDRLVYAIADGTRVAAVVQVLAGIHAAGFVNARWVPAPWLPMKFPYGGGVDPPMPPPPPITVTVGDVKLAGKSRYATDELARVVRARVGVYRACYHKELIRSPKIKGVLTVVAELDATGTMTTVTTSGSLKNDNVASCVKANFMRLRFPPKGKARFRVPLTFSTG
jgi:hypothetical protein